MKHVILIYLAFVYIALTACAGKSETFRFNSNANNVLVTVGEQSCTTPCQLEIEPQEEIYATVTHAQETGFYMKADPPHEINTFENLRIKFALFVAGDFAGFISSSTDNDFIDSISTDSIDFATATPASSTSSSTTTAVAPTSSTTEATLALSQAISYAISPRVWRYDTRAYYIYLETPYYALHDTELTGYVLTNFHIMQQELFATEQPLIEECIRLTGMPNVQNLLLESEDAVMFLDKLTFEKVKQILYSEASHSEKIATLSTLLWYDEAALERLYTNDAEFLEKITNYLRAKRVPLLMGKFYAETGAQYEHGNGVEQNYAEAAYWYKMAAEQGYADAQYSLGTLYEQGNGIEQSYGLAMYWYQKAAEQEHAKAMYSIGELYRQGYGVVQDLAEAERWYERAAELDSECASAFDTLKTDGKI